MIKQTFLRALSLNAFLLISGLYLQAVFAAPFESLIMPGELIEGHKKYEESCEKCHSSFSKTQQSQLCADCHEDIKQDLATKKGYHGINVLASKQACKQCHTDHRGRDASIIPLDKQTFNHQQTNFSLKGKHTSIACQSCHKPEKKFREATSSCYSCHKPDDPHNGKLGKKCNSCHNETSWKKISFDHDKTDFALKGKHKKLLCLSCHPDNRHKDTPKQCVACHALDDAHNTRYGNKCASCHTEEDWNKSHFNHDRETDYPLKGKHKNARCDACHTGDANIYKKKPKDTCVACHQSDDVHKGKNGNKCHSCHSPKSWGNSQFSHDRDTDFKLRGKHQKLSCNSCHQGDVHKNKLKTDCLGCHKVDDVHGGQQGKHCQQCHNETSWGSEVRFNHDVTAFPLIGLHAITPCEECHSSHKFKDSKADCVSCHQADDPHEKTLGTQCHQCHNPNSWQLWLFDHNKQTTFPLTDAHKNLQCEACHTEPAGQQVEKSSSCASCHFKDDIHRGGFGKHCEQCHNSRKFSDLTL
jgi:hypothetical protein